MFMHILSYILILIKNIESLLLELLLLLLLLF